MTEIQEKLGLSENESIEAIISSLQDLGAVYKSHNKHNLYITVAKGSLLDNEERLKRAKRSCELYINRVLKVDIE